VDDGSDIGDGSPRLEWDLATRRAQTRRRRLVLLFEQWGPDYVHQIAESDDGERAWLDGLAASGQVAYVPGRTAEQWRLLRDQQAGYANAQAMIAVREGRRGQARDLVDEAYALGGLLDAEWERMHRFLLTAAAGAGPQPPDPAAAA
jgi:hypothetical protein